MNRTAADSADASDRDSPDQDFSDPLSRSLYGELRRLARARMRRLRPGQTLQPTDLVHEAYIRLVQKQKQPWSSRGHFFGAAAQAMRDILVEHLRRKGAHKRGGDRNRVSGDVLDWLSGDDVEVRLGGNRTVASAELLTLHDALYELARELPEHARLVQLRYFTGLTMAEIAAIQHTSKSTVERRWRFARAWLQSRIEDMPTALFGAG